MHKLAIEDRLGKPLKSTDPLFLWLIEHVSAIFNRHVVGNDGKTPYERVHGAKPKFERFGKQIRFFIPKRRRAKMERKYDEGVYLGTGQNSNEHFIGRADGYVTRAQWLEYHTEASGKQSS